MDRSKATATNPASPSQPQVPKIKLRLEFGEDLKLGDVVEHHEGGEDQ
jgi:hypothetical protein